MPSLAPALRADSKFATTPSLALSPFGVVSLLIGVASWFAVVVACSRSPVGNS